MQMTRQMQYCKTISSAHLEHFLFKQNYKEELKIYSIETMEIWMDFAKYGRKLIEIKTVTRTLYGLFYIKNIFKQESPPT